MAAWPSGGDACRKQVSTATNKYLRVASKLRQACFRSQMQGTLPLYPAMNCADPGTWSAGGYSGGVAKLAAAAQAMTKSVGQRCRGALLPPMVGFGACPSPCDASVPDMLSFDDVAACMQCLGNGCQQYVDGESYGAAPLLDQRSDLPALSCQASVGRAVGEYIYKRLKLQARCQMRQEGQRTGWANVDCTDPTLPTHPQYGDHLGLLKALQSTVSRSCGNHNALATVLDTCGTDVASVLVCLQSASGACVNLVHGGAFPAPVVPTPTGSIIPSATPTNTPAAAGKPCTADDDCSGGNVCSPDGVCCDNRCDGTCESCLEAHTGAADGTCAAIVAGDDPQGECTDGNTCTVDSCDGARGCQAVPASNGTSCGDPTDDACSAPDTCDGTGVCRTNDRSLGTACGAPGTACEPQDTCDGAGNCQDNGFAPTGYTCGSPDTECSQQDTCDGAGQCQPHHLPLGSSCGDLASACKNADYCDGNGSCADGGAVAAGTHCGLAATECSGQDTCDGAGACQPNHLGPEVSCGPPANECTNAGSCDGTGRCTVEFLPAGSACGSPGTECSAQDTCDGSGTCMDNHLNPGSPCGDAGSECTIQDSCDSQGQCVDNGYRAVGTICGDPATECSEQDTCDGGGNCQVHDLIAGAPCGSALATDCTAPDTCNGAGACQANHAPVDSDCGDAGNDCTNQDKCNGDGACIDNGYISAGSACGDLSDTTCTDPDTCNGTGTCERNDVPNGSPCGDAGNECVLADSCDGFGECADRGYRPIGTACGSQVDTECDDPNSCDGAGTCRDNFQSTGSACGDPGSACVNQDSCDGAGDCADNGFVAAGTSCGDSSNTACTDPDSCDGNGVCAGNHATPGTLCGDPGTECTVQDTCNSDGTCADNGFVPRDTPCGSPAASECDLADSCNGAGTCSANYRLAGTACGDPGTPCVNQDVCNGTGSCLDVGTNAAGTPCADDGNPCTDDICGADGSCQHIPNQMPCDDSLFCNGADTCSAGGCTLHTGNPCPGPDGDTNCSETCNEVAKSCSLPDPDGSLCDDKLFCNGTEVCQAGVCVSQNIDPCPNGGAYGGDDDDDCRESCDEFTNTCTAPDPNGMPCNDTLFCTGGDVGNPCTQDADCTSNLCIDVCDGPDNGRPYDSIPCVSNNDCPSGGSCRARVCASSVYPINSVNIKIDQDRCQEGICLGGAPPCPGDAKDALGRGIGLSLTCQDACREASDSCDAPAVSGIDCSDDDYCNGSADRCSGGPASACVRSGDPCNNTCIVGSNPNDSNDPCFDPFNRNALGDDDNDCSESCADKTACSGWGCIGTGACDALDANNTVCKDGNYCTTGTGLNGDRCVAGACLPGTQSPCAGPGGLDPDCSQSCVDVNSMGWERGHCDGVDPNGSTCSDLLACNGTDTCLGGDCVTHSGDPCASFIGDNDNDCSESCFDPDGNGGNAAHSCTANDPVNSFCNDGAYCTTTDRCNSSGTCVGTGTPCSAFIADNDNNCREACNETLDNCTAPEPVGTLCNDGLFCTNTDTCNAAGNCAGAGNPCAALHAADSENANCQDSCNESSDQCNANDPNGATCQSDGRACNGAETCRSGVCQPEGVCCPEGHYTFSVNSNTGGTVDSAEWPGGVDTITATPRSDVPAGWGDQTCSVTTCLPEGNIDLTGHLGGGLFGIFSCDGQDFEIPSNGIKGWSSCYGEGGEDGDGCSVPSCPPAGIGYCEARRPACTAALNGSGRATFRVRCID